MNLAEPVDSLGVFELLPRSPPGQWCGEGVSRGVIAYRALLKHLLSHQPTTQVA